MEDLAVITAQNYQGSFGKYIVEFKRNNDKDGEERKKYTINDKKNNGHQNPLPHRRKNQNQARF